MYHMNNCNIILHTNIWSSVEVEDTLWSKHCRSYQLWLQGNFKYAIWLKINIHLIFFLFRKTRVKVNSYFFLIKWAKDHKLISLEHLVEIKKSLVWSVSFVKVGKSKRIINICLLETQANVKFMNQALLITYL